MTPHDDRFKDWNFRIFIKSTLLVYPLTCALFWLMSTRYTQI